MRRALWLATLGLAPFAFPVACGSLNQGEIQIIDEGAGAPATGGNSGSAGKAGASGSAGTTSSGGKGGKGGSSGKGGSGTSGNAGEAGIGASANGGSSGSAGTDGGSSGSGGDTGTGGSAGATPTECMGPADCLSAAPICDNGECRQCLPPASSGDTDECSGFPGRPHCDKKSGACVECVKSIDCTGSKPVCDAGVCRGCQEGSECDSLACVPGGRCADTSTVVYALAGTGSFAADCGTYEAPCLFLNTAVSLLSPSRPILVMLPTSEVFDESVILPMALGANLTIFGNGVKVRANDLPVFKLAGDAVTMDGVVIEETSSGTGGGYPALSCTSTPLKFVRGSVTNKGTSVAAKGFALADCNAEIQESTFSGNYIALDSISTKSPPAQTLRVERSYFEANREALHFDGAQFIIRNNLFIGNGQNSYVRIILPSAPTMTGSLFAYNTLFGNDNNCSYEGGLVACEGGANNCGRQTSNLFWHNMYNGATGTPCPDQVYETPPPIYNSITETTWAGSNNSTLDPLLKNPAGGDFTPDHGSYAIDNGETTVDVVPDVDFFGNPRSLGDGPDIGAIEAE